MKIGIDISQLAYPRTGVATYLENLVARLIEQDTDNEYILFFSSGRKKLGKNILKRLSGSHVTIKQFKLPPTLLDILWNKMHTLPIEWLVGHVDLFLTSDWTEPPAKKAKKATIIYDLLIYKYPEEMHHKIIQTQKKKLEWVKKESSMIFCISESTKKDVEEILKIDQSRLQVVYTGV